MQEKTFALSRRALLRTAAVGAAATAATATIPSVVMAADGVAADTSKIRNFDMIEAFYREYPKKLAVVRGTLNRPLTLTEKILFTHLYHPESLREFKRGVDYIELRPDRAGTHDIGGPMAIIQFLSSGKERIALPAALVCDHLVQANVGAIPDLKVAEKGNVETYEFLRDVSRRYGFDFWPAGSGICHQVFMENYNFPGCMMLVTDSHTPTAERIRLLEPFPAWDGQDFTALPLLIKAKGKCTTDHISPGGKWLPYRGNIDRISDNLLERAVNAFNGVSGKVWNTDTNAYDTPAKVARHYRNNNIASVIVGDDNYGEGSSREHAAMEPRYLNVRVVLAKSLACIHESNLKKQGILALTFVNPADYDKIQEKDRISVLNLNTLAPNSRVVIELTHENGTKERFEAKHSYNEKQLSWFRAGSALNALKA